MGDENHICTLGDYSKPSHKGYRNTIELPVGNNVVPLRTDTIRLVQNGCSFHGLRFEDPNQHLKDFLKLVDSLNLDGENKERTRLHLFQFSLCDQAINWLERLPAGSCEIDHAVDGKLYNKNADESWEIIKNLALYDHQGWTDTREFVKPVKAISTPQGISKTPDRRLLELEDQINFLLKGSRPNRRSSTQIPYAYADAVYSSHRPKNHDVPPKLNPFTFRECTCPSPQPQALGNTFKARIEMFRLLKELRTSRTPEKVFIREESKLPITKNVNSISLARGDEERSDKMEEILGNTVKSTITAMKIPRSSKKITKKEDVGGNFKIPCSMRGLKYMNALIDQGFDVNVMPYSTYMKLTDEMPTQTDIRLSLASHSYIYPFGIAEDVLVEVAEQRDGGKGTWGGRAKGFGTVSVCVRVQERAGEGVVLLARKVV
nr:MAK10-like protein [Tanacetum cinerariifolium]